MEIPPRKMGKTKPPRFKDGGYTHSGEFVVPSSKIKIIGDKLNNILELIGSPYPELFKNETQQQVFIQNCNNCGANDWQLGEQLSYCNYCRSSIILPTNKPFAIVTSTKPIPPTPPKSIYTKF